MMVNKCWVCNLFSFSKISSIAISKYLPFKTVWEVKRVSDQLNDQECSHKVSSYFKNIFSAQTIRMFSYKYYVN